MNYRIKQIIPALGWYEASKNDNGDLYFDPLACWALLEIDHENEKEDLIVGVPGGRCYGISGYYPIPSDFVGYLSPDDFEIPGVKLRQGVLPRNAGA